jgi:hypothetical protein
MSLSIITVTSSDKRVKISNLYIKQYEYITVFVGTRRFQILYRSISIFFWLLLKLEGRTEKKYTCSRFV